MRPYYTDPYTVVFDANVIELKESEGKHAAILDSTYFYPTSGGQEHDTGFINGIPVVDVLEENDNIVHILAEKAEKGKAHCNIDWSRRFSNMQQHTGQHILSAAFENLFNISTVSSRLGENAGTIDLSRQPSEEEIQKAVAEANRIVREDREVAVHFADQQNIGSFNLRKPPKVEGTVRIIDVKDFDLSPCGGTHCTHASEVGFILTGDTEKVKGSLTRIGFYCGDRAISHYYRLHNSARDSARGLSTFVDEMPTAIEKLKSQLQEKDTRIKSLSERVLNSKCDELKPQIEKASGSLTVVDLTDDTVDANELRFVASCISRVVRKSFAFHRIDSNICQMNLNLLMSEEDANAVLNDLRNKCGVKGGGRNGFYSINFERARFDEVMEALRGRLTNE
ncbi:MAG: alanyl-tRNA editing protein [Bacteroidetes bacterium]|nr:alanyl-tRNA editing protein [Bacteroidota bacterium]